VQHRTAQLIQMPNRDIQSSRKHAIP